MARFPFSSPSTTNDNLRGVWRRRCAYLGFGVAGLLLLQPASAALAYPNPATVNLGTAATFSVLAGSTVTNTGATVISADAGVGGNLGVSPGTAVTGFPPGTVTAPGTIHAGDATAATAQTAAGTASVDAAGRTPNQTFDPIYDLVGQTFTAGVYKAPTSLAVGGTGATVTLDGQNNPDAVFIFQIGSTLVTGSSSTVALINGAQACNVFWQVGSSATLGANSTFNGTILASASASLGAGVNVQGRVLASTGAVTLINDTINTPACAPSSGVASAPLFGSAGGVVAVATFLGGIAVLVFVRRARRPAYVS
jgi:Ice-binding-like